MKGDSRAIDRLESLPRSAVLLPQPVIAEIRFGLARLPQSKRRQRLESRFEVILADVGRAAWTDEVSLCFGRVKAGLERAGRRLEDFDLAIAAHAIASEGVLATSNVGHMSRIRGLAVEDWTAGPHAAER